ncbi:MAG TPA: hypothetical protein VF765_26575 [Polyangiaceae bacterium]
MRRIWWAVVLLGGAAGSLVAAACTDSTQPLGQGNTVVGAPSSTDQPTGPGGDAGAYYDGLYAYDSPYPPPPDGYSPIALCKSCACPATDYCFGGGTGYTAFNGSCNAEASADAFALGCQPIPPQCLTVADGGRCECLLKYTSFLPCYPDCIENSLTLYCPHP